MARMLGSIAVLAAGCATSDTDQPAASRDKPTAPAQLQAWLASRGLALTTPNNSPVAERNPTFSGCPGFAGQV
jgi:hypothetical protein